jgi:hypothetical protein
MGVESRMEGLGVGAEREVYVILAELKLILFMFLICKDL